MSYPLLSLDGELKVVDVENSKVLVMVKSCKDHKERMLFVFNRSDCETHVDIKRIFEKVGAHDLKESEKSSLVMQRYGFTLWAI